MVRLWVQILPQFKDEKGTYFDMREFQKSLVGLEPNSNIEIYEELRVSPYRIDNKWWQVFKKRTVHEYLKQNFNLDDDSISEKLNFFKIKPEYKINRLGSGHQKAFSIICEFQKSKNVIFDYYGLSPQSEIELTSYVLTELYKGKSAICFDNLQFKDGSTDSKNIINFNIYRKDKIGVDYYEEKNDFKLKRRL
ncbi:MAG: hypothetical protein R3E32_27460 [Chitinophagales bacterium]